MWKEEFTVLAGRLNEHHHILPYTLAFKLLGSFTFGDFINVCAKAQIDVAMTDALEMVKDNYPYVNVAQSKYGYKLGAKDRADKELA